MGWRRMSECSRQYVVLSFIYGGTPIFVVISIAYWKDDFEQVDFYFGSTLGVTDRISFKLVQPSSC